MPADAPELVVTELVTNAALHSGSDETDLLATRRGLGLVRCLATWWLAVTSPLGARAVARLPAATG